MGNVTMLDPRKTHPKRVGGKTSQEAVGSSMLLLVSTKNQQTPLPKVTRAASARAWDHPNLLAT